MEWLRSAIYKTLDFIVSPLKNVLNKLISMQVKHIVILIVAGLGLGLYLNSKNPIKNFFRIELIGGIVLGISVYMFKKILAKETIIRTSVSTKRELAVYVEKFYANNNSSLNYLIGIITGVFYCYIALNLNFVKVNIVGCYCLLALLVVCVFITKMLLNYIYLIYIFYKINDLKKIEHHALGIKNANWLFEINYLCNISRNCLLISMTLMFIVFILFSPANTVEIILNYDRGNMKATLMIIYWAIAILLTFIVLPILTNFQNKLLNKIVKKINDDSINQYEDILIDKEREAEVENALSLITYINGLSDKFIYENRIRYISAGYYVTNFISILVTIIFTIVNAYADLIV